MKARWGLRGLLMSLLWMSTVADVIWEADLQPETRECLVTIRNITVVKGTSFEMPLTELSSLSSAMLVFLNGSKVPLMTCDENCTCTTEDPFKDFVSIGSEPWPSAIVVSESDLDDYSWKSVEMMGESADLGHKLIYYLDYVDIALDNYPGDTSLIFQPGDTHMVGAAEDTVDVVENGGISLMCKFDSQSRPDVQVQWNVNSSEQEEAIIGHCNSSADADPQCLMVSGLVTSLCINGLITAEPIERCLGASISCMLSSGEMAEKILNVFSPAILTDLQVEIQPDDWSERISLNVTNMFSTIGMYNLGLTETYTSSPWWFDSQSSSANPIEALDSEHMLYYPVVSVTDQLQNTTGSDGKEYMEGVVQRIVPLQPIVSDNRIVDVHLCAGSSLQACTSALVVMVGHRAPDKPSHNCTGLDYLPHNGTVNCRCTSTCLGRPAGGLRWRQGNQTVDKGAYGVDDLLLGDLQALDREQHVYCDVDWITPLKGDPLPIAYGPDSVDLQLCYRLGFTLNQRLLVIECVVTGMEPMDEANVTWGGVCASGENGVTWEGLTCTVDLSVTDVTGRNVSCEVANPKNVQYSKRSEMALPIPKPASPQHNCTLLVLTQSSISHCSCSIDASQGYLTGRLQWWWQDQLLAQGELNQTELLLEKSQVNIDAVKEKGHLPVCRLDWMDTANMILPVAYGSINVIVHVYQQYVNDQDGHKIITVADCDVNGLHVTNPQTITWSGATCQDGAQGKKCVMDLSSNDLAGKTLKCTFSDQTGTYEGETTISAQRAEVINSAATGQVANDKTDVITGLAIAVALLGMICIVTILVCLYLKGKPNQVAETEEPGKGVIWGSAGGLINTGNVGGGRNMSYLNPTGH